VKDLDRSSLDPFVDWAELLPRVDDDQELVQELFELFREEFPRMRDDLRHAVELGDFAEIQRSAHALKGMLVNLSLKQGAALAANIENSARAGDSQGTSAAAEAFEREAERFLPAMGAFLTGLERWKS
jgi:two-component system, sensor histidine kinase and response regulator